MGNGPPRGQRARGRCLGSGLECEVWGRPGAARRRFFSCLRLGMVCHAHLLAQLLYARAWRLCQRSESEHIEQTGRGASGAAGQQAGGWLHPLSPNPEPVARPGIGTPLYLLTCPLVGGCQGYGGLFGKLGAVLAGGWWPEAVCLGAHLTGWGSVSFQSGAGASWLVGRTRPCA